MLFELPIYDIVWHEVLSIPLCVNPSDYVCCHFLLPCGAPLCEYVAIYYQVPWLTHVKIVFNLKLL